jgi:hypothetical protein
LSRNIQRNDLQSRFGGGTNEAKVRQNVATRWSLNQRLIEGREYLQLAEGAENDSGDLPLGPLKMLSLQ